MNDSLNDEESLSLDAAASALGVTPLNVLMHVKRKMVEGQEVDGQWVISRKSLAAFLLSRSKEDPPLCVSQCSKKGGCSSCG